MMPRQNEHEHDLLRFGLGQLIGLPFPESSRLAYEIELAMIFLQEFFLTLSLDELPPEQRNALKVLARNGDSDQVLSALTELSPHLEDKIRIFFYERKKGFIINYLSSLAAQTQSKRHYAALELAQNERWIELNELMNQHA